MNPPLKLDIRESQSGFNVLFSIKILGIKNYCFSCVNASFLLL